MTDDPIDFDQISALLRDLGALQSAAELHGFLVGQLAAGQRPSRSEWLRAVNEQADLSSNPDEVAGDCLHALYKQTLTALLDSDLEFQLLLPGDEMPLTERAASLGEWCQGFLLGYGLSGNTTTADAEVAEALRDLAAIAQIGASEDDIAEASSESDFFAICEYVRLAAADMFWRNHSETAPAAPTQPQSGSTPANLFQRNKLH